MTSPLTIQFSRVSEHIKSMAKTKKPPLKNWVKKILTQFDPNFYDPSQLGQISSDTKLSQCFSLKVPVVFLKL